jgi:hypothetical protein
VFLKIPTSGPVLIITFLQFLTPFCKSLLVRIGNSFISAYFCHTGNIISKLESDGRNCVKQIKIIGHYVKFKDQTGTADHRKSNER